MEPVIFHIDVNSAFLSWTAIEQLKNGSTVDLRTIPAIIGGDRESRHGIVLAKSTSAKTFGIKTGEPVAHALRKCESLVIARPDHAMYRQYSKQLMTLLRTFTPDIEQLSIDECFLDFTPIAYQYESPIAGATLISKTVKEQLGFTVNIGIAPNKLLAKMASDFEKPDRIHTLWKEEIPKKLWPLPIEDLYMVGRSSSTRLRSLGITTIGELAHTDKDFLMREFKSHGLLMWEYANGIAPAEVHSTVEKLKGVGNSTTLPKDLITEAEALPVLKDLAVSVGRRLRKAGQKAGMVSVEIKYHTFNQVSHQKQMERQTNQDQDIYQASIELFRELWSGEPIRLLGIRTSKLSEESEPEQLSLFDMKFESEEMRKKKKNLKEALKKLEGKYGDGIVKKGW